MSKSASCVIKWSISGVPKLEYCSVEVMWGTGKAITEDKPSMDGTYYVWKVCCCGSAPKEGDFHAVLDVLDSLRIGAMTHDTLLCKFCDGCCCPVFVQQ